MQSYWEWEANLLREEVLYFEGHLRSLKNKIDAKVSKKLAAEVKKAISADLKGTVKRVLDDTPAKTSKKMNREEKIRNEVEAFYATQKTFLLRGYERALFEEQIHLKQKSSNRYKKLFQ
jgi:hypothetical protein